MNIDNSTSVAFYATSSNSSIENKSADPSIQDPQLTNQEKQQIKELKARDRVVKAHEQAHIAAGQGVVKGGASYTYQRGPDGVLYAIGGEVQIDTSEVSGDPQATLEKAQKIRAAALAPAQPSSQDRLVAAKAAQMAIEAQAEINKERQNNTANTHNEALSSFGEKSSQNNNSFFQLSI